MRYLLLSVVGFIMLYPLIWLVGASFKTNAEIFSSPGFIPRNPTFHGYIEGWKTSTAYTFATFFWNTFLIIAPKVIGTAISCTAVAYGFARFDFPGKKILFASLIATLLLPNVVTRIPQYLLFRDIGWLDTFLPLWVPSAFAGDAFFVFMLVQFLRAIPRDMEEAARVDGASTWQTLIFIVVPLLTAGADLGLPVPVHVVDERLPRPADLPDRRSTNIPCRWRSSCRSTRPSIRVEPHPGDVGPRAHAVARRVLHRRRNTSSKASPQGVQGLITMARLQIRNLEKIYANSFKAVHGIDLDVADGEFMVLVGPSGCAKSTTLRMIAGLETISGGQIVIGDSVVNDLTPGQRGISMVFQNYALYPHMKVRNNLSFSLKLKRRNPRPRSPSAPQKSRSIARDRVRCSIDCPSSSRVARRSASRSAVR